MRYNRQCISISAVIRQGLRLDGYWGLCGDKAQVDWSRRLGRLRCPWQVPSQHFAAAPAAIPRRWTRCVQLGCSPAAQHCSSNRAALQSCGRLKGAFAIQQPAAAAAPREGLLQLRVDHPLSKSLLGCRRRTGCRLAVAGRIPSRELSHHAATTAAAMTAPSTVASVAEAPCGGSTQKRSACLHSDSLGK